MGPSRGGLLRSILVSLGLVLALACDEAPVTVAGQTSCGDGIVDPGEGCDDGNIEDGDGCDSRCVQVADADADADGDGVGDSGDHCADVSNPNQGDRDGDGLGDDCDEQPELRNFRLRRSGPLILVQNSDNSAHHLQGQLASQGQMSARSDRFHLKGGFHVVLPQRP